MLAHMKRESKKENLPFQSSRKPKRKFTIDSDDDDDYKSDTN